MQPNRPGPFAALVLFGFILCLGPAPASAAGGPLGRWLTEDNDGVVEIDRCGGAALCGRIVGVTLDRPTDPEPRDVYGRPICGLTIITSAEQTGPDVWTGHITNPKNGKIYNAQISIDAVGRLHLRGYVGLPLFGETVVWHPFEGRIGEHCHIGSVEGEVSGF